MEQVGKFVIVQNIGSGQFGSAYKVKHAVTGKMLCMKQIPITAENQESSMKEARFLAQLASHDMKNINVVRYEESFLDKDNLYIVMELCDGDLDTEIKQQKAKFLFYSEDEIMGMFVQILMGLAHIHNNRILHRDLKAQNIFLTKGGIVKLGDMGIAKVIESTLEQCKSFVGTPYYMAPEVCSSSPYTSQADMWSLGCVLYELCTLEHAFSADSLYALIFRIINGSYKPIDQTKYSASLSSLVATLLDKDPGRRPSCRALLSSHFVRTHIEKTMNKTVAGQLLRPRGRAGQHGHGDTAPFIPPQAGPSSQPVPSPSAVPATPREQLRARKLAEADRRMREVTLQIHTTTHEKQRVRERKEEMLQGTARRLDSSPQVEQQRRGRSYHGMALDNSPEEDVVWSPPSRAPAAMRPMSVSGLPPASHLPSEHAAETCSALPQGGIGGRQPGGRALAPSRRSSSGAVAASHDDRLACTGATTYRLPAYSDEEEDWAEENAEILAGASAGVAVEGVASRATDSDSGSRPQGGLRELHIPRMESAGSAATPTTAPSTAPSTGGTPVRFGMDTLERKQFSEQDGLSPVPVSPLCSPVVHFGTGLPNDGGFAFAYRQTPSSPASGGQGSQCSGLAGPTSHAVMSPLARAAHQRATTSADYSEEYSEDYDSENSGSSEGAKAAPARAQVRALLNNLRSAQEAHTAAYVDVEIIADEEPSSAVLMTLRSSDMKEMCKAALGPFFNKAYSHCHSRYVQDDVNMQEVQVELLQLVDLPAATKRGAVQQLELLVYQELHSPSS